MDLPSWVGRVALLGFTVVSVVATSPPPSWSRLESTPIETLVLAPATPVVRHIRVTASAEGYVEPIIEPAPTGTELSIRACGDEEAHVYRRVYGGWSRDGVGPTVYMDAHSPPSVPRLNLGRCETGLDTTVDVSFENLGAEPVSIDWSARAYIEGDTGEEDEPAGTHLEVAIAP